MKKELIVKWKVNADAVPQVMALLPELVEQSQAEPGNELYTVYQSEADPTELVLHERYASPEALEAHKNAAHYQQLVVGQIVPLLALREVSLVNRLY